MYKSKPVAILKTFTSKDFRKFDEYVLSPFFNKDDKVSTLYRILKAAHPNYTSKAINRTKVFPKIFPKLSFNEQKLRYVMSALTKLLEDFLAYKMFKENDGVTSRYLLTAYRKRGLHKYFTQTYENSKNTLVKSNLRNSSYHFNQYLLSECKYAFEADKDDRNVGAYIDLLKKLDVYYINNKLKICCDLYNDARLVSIDFEEPAFLPEITQHIKDNTIDISSINIYYHILQTIVGENGDVHYHNLLEALDVHKHEFTDYELNNMYTFASNYIIRQSMRNRKRLPELFELYQLLFERKILPPKEGYLSQFHYKNIIQLSLSLNNVAYAQHVIEKYTKHLSPEVRENVYTYSQACLAYHQQQYQDTILLLHNVAFTDPYYHTDTKSLLMKSYYELEEIIPLYNLIDTFKAYLRRNKRLSHNRKQLYLNLCKYIKKLTRLKMGSKKSIEQLRNEIAVNLKGSESHRNWLYEKIEEISRKKRKY